ncbi:hypothetical protein AXF42_Ash015400 [Apostasia shenzhenica]|uniref:Uncharacterized protein n=1 Tax=Apostasia shenzhenica TaxID=1088818 RepID=A0A2H9ZS43_9ASPA|nr:hypothetical protein AXF42_Ash015400 [Apostasia shenzhenica]
MESRRMPTMFSFSNNGVEYMAVLVEEPPGGSWTFDEFCSICNQPLSDLPFYTTEPSTAFYVHANCAYSKASRPPPPPPPPPSPPPHHHHEVAPSSSAAGSAFSDSTSPNISSNQIHHAPRFVSGPFHPSSNVFYPTAPPAYNPYRSYDPYYYYYYNHLPPNFQYYNHLPNHGSYHDQYYSDQFPHTNYYYHIQQPPSYATGQFPPAPPHHQHDHRFPPAPPHHQHDHRPSSFSLTSSTSSSSSLGWAGLAASTVLGSLLQALFSTMFSS